MTAIDGSIQKVTLKLLNVLFHLLHLSIIFFFLVGWISLSTRTAHFVLALLILLSWYGLGLFFGFGYCLVTDIQWRLKKKLGQDPSTEYYIKYVIDRITGSDIQAGTINKFTTWIFFVLLVASSMLMIDRHYHL